MEVWQILSKKIEFKVNLTVSFALIHVASQIKKIHLDISQISSMKIHMNAKDEQLCTGNFNKSCVF